MTQNSDDQDREAKGSSERRREPAGESSTARSGRSRMPGRKKKAHRTSRVRSKKGDSAARGARRKPESGPAPEPPPIIPQPSIDSYEEGTPEENRPEQEPPPPTASAYPGEGPGGDSDDLFEYVL